MRYALLLVALCAACNDQPAPSGNHQAPAPAPAAQNAAVAVPQAGPEASLAEKPAAPGSAQAAATQVETFYALVEAGKWTQAQAMLWDTQEDARLRYGKEAQVHAEVLAPGPIEGAAGSLYVEVPVREYGLTKAGKPFSWSGKVVVRRVNDVPGASARQLAWHLYKFDFKRTGDAE